MSNKLGGVIVVKIGGSTFGKHEPSVLDVGDVEDIVELQRRGTPMPTLEVVISVLAGLANKEIVTLINSREGKAVGISGVDGALLEAKLREKEMGFVGTVTRVNTGIIDTLVSSGYIPVVAPLSIYAPGGSGGEPQILNVNGDTVAGEIAEAIAAEQLVFLTDVDGIHDKQDNLIPRLSPVEAEELLSSGVASGGMIPKLKACLRALTRCRTASIIGGTTPHALLREIEGNNIGTTIQKD